MDQWRSKFSESFSLDRYWSIECSSLFFQDHGKGGLSLRGVAFMTVSAVLTVLAVLESTLPSDSVCLSYKTQHNETTIAVLTVLAIMAVSVMTTQTPFSRVHAKGVVLCERPCFCLLSTF